MALAWPECRTSFAREEGTADLDAASSATKLKGNLPSGLELTTPTMEGDLGDEEADIPESADEGGEGVM